MDSARRGPTRVKNLIFAQVAVVFVRLRDVFIVSSSRIVVGVVQRVLNVHLEVINQVRLIHPAPLGPVNAVIMVLVMMVVVVVLLVLLLLVVVVHGHHFGLDKSCHFRAEIGLAGPGHTLRNGAAVGGHARVGVRAGVQMVEGLWKVGNQMVTLEEDNKN